MKSIADILNLSGKNAIVTGGSVGIGYGIVRRLAEAGANVVIANKTEKDGLRAAGEIAGKRHNVTAIATDVAIRL